MKKCSYCGKEYGDEAASCSIDGQALGIEPPDRQKRIGTSRPRKVIIIWGIVIGLGLICWLYCVYLARLLSDARDF